MKESRKREKMKDCPAHSKSRTHDFLSSELELWHLATNPALALHFWIEAILNKTKFTWLCPYLSVFAQVARLMGFSFFYLTSSSDLFNYTLQDSNPVSLDYTPACSTVKPQALPARAWKVKQLASDWVRNLLERILTVERKQVALLFFHHSLTGFGCFTDETQEKLLPRKRERNNIDL